MNPEDRDWLLDRAENAFDNVHDMDVPTKTYCAAIVDALPVMGFQDFHHLLRILCNIDRADAPDVFGPSLSDDDASWLRFRDNPWQWFIRAPDKQARAIWEIALDRLEASRRPLAAE